MISKWNYQPLTHQQKKDADAMLPQCGGATPIAELLIRRGVNTPEEAQAFFSPSISDLHDPFLMPDMHKAVKRLNEAMGAKERIMIYGDYDVDGTTAVALVYKYLQNYYSNIEYYIPTRYEEGYGISLKSIEYAAENDVKLVIVLDCGIKAIDEIAYAKEKGIDFIILRSPCARRGFASGCRDPESQNAGFHLSLPASVRLRCRFQIHAGLCSEQWSHKP